MLERFQKIQLIQDYLKNKLLSIKEHNQQVAPIDSDGSINGRRLTNIGTFRAYCRAYLRQHPRVRQDMTLLVRQLAPSQEGLPVEFYLFSNDTEWSNYEDIQSDLFDHLISIVPEFELAVFQKPGAQDLQKYLRATKTQTSNL
jgi:miniconductance mechanosensitive channel